MRKAAGEYDLISLVSEEFLMRVATVIISLEFSENPGHLYVIFIFASPKHNGVT